MDFHDLLTPDDVTEVRQAIADVAYTFSKKNVTLIRITTTEHPHGESPLETEVEIPLKALHVTPEEAAKVENRERAQIDWDARLMFGRDYLVEEGQTELAALDNDRAWQWIMDGERFRQSAVSGDGQFVEDFTLVYVDLERR